MSSMQYLAISLAQVSEDIHLFWNPFRHVDSRNEVLMNPLSMLTTGIILKSFHEVYCMMIPVEQSQPNKKDFKMIALTGMLIVSIFFNSC